MNDRGYLGNPLLKGVGVELSFTPEQVAEWLKCAEDPIYFIENYVKIVTLDDGLKLMKLFEYQKDIVRSLWLNRFSIGSLPRQCGKTTCVAAFFVWYITFNSNKTCAILANKAATAREILSRVQKAFEYLPKWLQHGVVEWNKGSFELENGSRILAASTSSSAIRGFSINCVTGSTLVTVRNSDGEFVREIREAFIEQENYTEILTSKGFRKFDGFVNNGVRKVGDLHINGRHITCTPDHRILIDGEWRESQTLEGFYPRENGEEVYDAVNVSDGNEYLTNNIPSHNCLLLDEFAFVPNNIADEFFASVYPTIASGKESKLAMVSTPNGLNHFHKFFKEAEAGVNGFNLTKAIWSDVPGRDQAWADQQRKILGEVKFAQEMECVGRNTTITIRDKYSGEIIELPIGDAYEILPDISVY